MLTVTTRCYRSPDEIDLAVFAEVPRTAQWWWAHPTVVAQDERGTLIGYASFSLSLPPTVTLAELQPRAIGWGQGMAVHPEFRGRGIGQQLIEARVRVLHELGVHFFIGHAAPANTAMAALFARQGLTPAATLPQADGTDLIYYMGAL